MTATGHVIYDYYPVSKMTTTEPVAAFTYAEPPPSAQDGLHLRRVGVLLTSGVGTMWKRSDRAVWIGLVLSMVYGTLTAAQSMPGEVKGSAKISATAGSFTGPLAYLDWFGSSAAAIGDLDGDGLREVVVGAPRDDDGGSGTFAERGAVWVLFLNGDGSVRMEQKISDTEGGFTGALSDSDVFGDSVASIGDFNGDGIPDVAVGAPGDNDGGPVAGAVWLLMLAADGTVQGHHKIGGASGALSGQLDPGGLFGSSVASVGDLDGDEIPELAVGARWDDGAGWSRGAVWVLFLESDGSVRRVQKVNDVHGGFAGALSDGDEFGTSLAAVGDCNGDSVPDLAVGVPYYRCAPSEPQTGAVWVLHLDPTGQVRSEQLISDCAGGMSGVLDAGGFFGQGLAALGDLDGDGRGDLAVGAFGIRDGDAPNFKKGGAWILFLNELSQPGSSQKISMTAGGFTGPLDKGDAFGYSVAFLGDVNGDGVGDLCCGALGDDDGAEEAGAVWVLFLRAAMWLDLGHGLGGSGGIPQLRGTGTFVAGTDVELHLSGAVATSPALLVAGTSAANIPFKGGVMVPSPDFIVAGPVTGADGTLDMSRRWPDGVPSEWTTYLQFWISDPAGPSGVAASNAISGTTP